MTPHPFAKSHEIANRLRAGNEKRPLLAKTASDEASLYVYEVIGEDWWTGGGVTAKAVVEALDAMKGVKTLNVYINSEGGDVFEAKAIHSALRRFEAEKVVHIDGIAASAATFIAMAGDRIITAPAATWMIHEAWSMAAGRASDMRAMADLLDMQNNSLAETYAKQTGKDTKAMLELMAAETWMSAKEALDLGFTDEIGADSASETKASASPLVAAAAQTHERLLAFSQAERLAAKADMRRRVQDTHNSKGR